MSHWLVYTSADMISISLLVPLYSLSGAISITQNFAHTHANTHTLDYMLTIALILCMIRSDAHTHTQAGIHLRHPPGPHVFCVAAGLLPSRFISLHLDETFRDTLVLLQVNTAFKPPTRMPGQGAEGSGVGWGRWWSRRAFG